MDMYAAGQVRALPRSKVNNLLIEAVDWCERFLSRPSKLVGRSGNVCPFVPESMMRGALKFAVIHFKNKQTAIPEIEEIVAIFRERFLAEERAVGRMDIFRSWILIFPEVAPSDATDMIDALQKRMKPSFIREGLMLGEFHPMNVSPGLRNPAFRPLRSPTPLLVIRHMVESDIDFLTRSFDPAKIRIQSLKAYLQFLGKSLSVASQLKVKQALSVAEASISLSEQSYDQTHPPKRPSGSSPMPSDDTGEIASA